MFKRIHRSFSSAPGIGFGMSPEQKELQELAKKFTLQEIIPKVYIDMRNS